MTDTNTAERESFEAHYRRCDANDATLSRWVDDGSTPPAMVGKYIIRSVQDAWLAFQAGRASLAASAGGEPVAAGSIDHLKLMMEESAWGGQILLSDALANIDEFAGLHHSPPEGMAGLPTRNELALQLLVAGGFVTEKKLAEALALVDAACPALSPPLPASEAKEL